jgi:hypothetical protein
MVKDPDYGPKGTARVLMEGLKRGDIKPSEFRIRPLFEALVPDGREILQDYGSGEGFSTSMADLLEAGVVKSSQFSQITGQLVYSKTLESYQDEEYVFSKLIQEIQTPGNLDMEKVAGISGVGNENQTVGEGMPYPDAGPVSDYIHLPPVQKRGMKIALTWEAVYSDRTSQLLGRAGEIGKYLGYDKELRIIDAIVDENAGAVSAVLGGHRYFWRDTSYATYQTTTPYDNVTAGNALVDWTDIEGAELTLSRITDPNTGLPILINPTHVIVTKQLEYTANYVLSATSLAIHAGGYNASTTVNEMLTSNFITKYTVVTSRILETRMATDTDWYLCNPKAWAYRVAIPLETQQAADNHPDFFDRDIVNQWKTREMGAACTLDPRLVTESRA